MLETRKKSVALPLNYRPRADLPEFTLPEVLPVDPATLTALLIASVSAKVASDEHITYLYEQIALMRSRLFGPSAESANQGRLFDEAEVLAATSTGAQDVAPLPAQACAPQTKARGKRGPLPTELGRGEIIHDVPEAERICDCGTPMVGINRVVSEQLDITPIQLRVLQHIRLVYGCQNSERAPATAAVPPPPLPKSNASPGLRSEERR